MDTLMAKRIIYFISEARSYVERIQTDGVDNPVDIDTNSYTMQMPEWYDEELFKRYVFYAVFDLHICS